MTSAAAALGADGFSNVLQLPPARRVCVVMVDGLGKALLKQRGGHAPFLRQAMENCRAPSAVGLSIDDGGVPRQPGDRTGRRACTAWSAMTCWTRTRTRWSTSSAAGTPGVDPRLWQPIPTVFEQVAEQLPVTTVSLPRFADSGMTRAALRGSAFGRAQPAMPAPRGGRSPGSRPDRALVTCTSTNWTRPATGSVPASAQWGSELEELDSAHAPAGPSAAGGHAAAADRRPRHAGRGRRVQRIDYSADPALVAGVRHTAGEPRMVHLYFEPDATAAHRPDRRLDAWRAALRRSEAGSSPATKPSTAVSSATWTPKCCRGSVT